jgi:hypothetical protein
VNQVINRKTYSKKKLASKEPSFTMSNFSSKISVQGSKNITLNPIATTVQMDEKSTLIEEPNRIKGRINNEVNGQLYQPAVS